MQTSVSLTKFADQWLGVPFLRHGRTMEGVDCIGLVLAAMGAADVHLIESDRRKCAFLGEAARAIGVPVTIHSERIEDVTPFAAQTIVSRALAQLPELLDLAVGFSNEHSILLFLKGRTVDEELTRARKEWSMRVDQIPSRTDPEGTILRLEAISRVLHATPPH